MSGLRLRLPATMLERLHLAATTFGCLSILPIFQVHSPLHSRTWLMASAAALVLLVAVMIATYRRRRTFWFEPVLTPALVIIGGSGLVDPYATTGLAWGMVIAQSLYGSRRVWAIRSIGALLTVPFAVALTPLADGRPISWASPTTFNIVPQIALLTILIRGAHAILLRNARSVARDAVLAHAGNRLLGTTDPERVSEIGREAAAELATLCPDVELDGAVPRAVGRRPILDEILDAFRNLANQVALAHTICVSHAELRQRAHELLISLKQLSDAQRRLIDLSRQAGMADVASSVLHNVGNVLTSMNTSVSMIGSSVTGSKVCGLVKVVELVGRNRADLGRYLSEDERGRRVPDYLTEVATVLDRERSLVLHEVALLQTSLEHVNAIIATQQLHIAGATMVEDVTISSLLDDAIHSTAVAAGHDSDATIVRDYGDIPTFAADRYKILQIATNLIANARRAVVGAVDPTIIIRSSSTAGSAVILVEDRGAGIAEADLSRLFSYDFSTKPTGDGFSLHASANAAKVIGADLSCRSDGPGKGATFILTIPLTGARSM
jgi:signal transduction histidine kinase